MTDNRRATENEDDPGPSAGADYGIFSVGPDETASEAVVHAVAATADTDPFGLAPLYGAIDPDALDGLVRPADPEPTAAPGGIVVAFSYAGYRITVDECGLIRLRGER